MAAQKLNKGLLQNNGIPEGLIITRVNRREIRSAQDVEEAVKGLQPDRTGSDPGFHPGRQRQVLCLWVLKLAVDSGYSSAASG
ncbi:MAG: hypothetical protein U5L96_05500 [Owenweeksia sp.]|nr:hypothetical protein [Owenweeksia sp.]